MKRTIPMLASMALATNVSAAVPKSLKLTSINPTMDTYHAQLAQDIQSYESISKLYGNHAQAVKAVPIIEDMQRFAAGASAVDSLLSDVDYTGLLTELFEEEPKSELEELIDQRQNPNYNVQTLDPSDSFAQKLGAELGKPIGEDIKDDIMALQLIVDDNYINCATHQANLDNFESISSYSRITQDKLRESGDFDPTQLTYDLTSVRAKAYQGARVALASYDVNCNNVSPRLQVQEDLVLTFSSEDFQIASDELDKLIDESRESREREPVREPVREEVRTRYDVGQENNSSSGNYQSDSRPQICKHIENGYLPLEDISNTQLYKVLAGSQGPATGLFVLKLLDLETRAILRVDEETGLIKYRDGTRLDVVWPRYKNLCVEGGLQ